MLKGRITMTTAMKLHPNTQLGAVKLKVSNLQTSMKFYQELVGLKLLSHQGNIAELTVDGVHPILILEELAQCCNSVNKNDGLVSFCHTIA